MTVRNDHRVLARGGKPRLWVSMAVLDSPGVPEEYRYLELRAPQEVPVWSGSLECEGVFDNSNCKATLWVASSQCLLPPISLVSHCIVFGDTQEIVKLLVNTTPTPTLSAFVPHPAPCEDAGYSQPFELTGGQSGYISDTSRAPRGVPCYVATSPSRRLRDPERAAKLVTLGAEGIPKAVPQNVVTQIRSCTASLRVRRLGE